MTLLFDDRARQVERDTGRALLPSLTRESNPSRNSECTQGKHFPRNKGNKMSNVSSSEAAKALVRRNTEEVQGEGRFDVFDELFADDFTDHTPQPNTAPDKAGVRKLYTHIFVPHSATFVRRSTGNLPMVTE